jgi:hypothetical protein
MPIELETDCYRSDDDQKAAEIEAFYEIRRQEGLKLDPETAVVTSHYTDEIDPYGIYQQVYKHADGGGCGVIGRSDFARAPDSDIWVECGEIPAETWARLVEVHKKREATDVPWLD